jgi:predicted nucleotidyltransferase
MKKRTEIETILRQLKPELAEKYHVKEIGIFGSYARGEEREGSDVDILVTLSEPIGWEIVDLKDLLEDNLGLRVDLATMGAIRPKMRTEILKEVVYA